MNPWHSVASHKTWSSTAPRWQPQICHCTGSEFQVQQQIPKQAKCLVCLISGIQTVGTGNCFLTSLMYNNYNCIWHELPHILLRWLFHIYCYHLVIWSVTLLQKKFSSLKTTVFPQHLSTWVDVLCLRHNYIRGWGLHTSGTFHSVCLYQYMLCEEWRPRLHCSRTLKTHKLEVLDILYVCVHAQVLNTFH